jgi:hypothetical protein
MLANAGSGSRDLPGSFRVAIGCAREPKLPCSSVLHLYEVVPGSEMSFLGYRSSGVDRCEGNVPSLTLMIDFIDGELRGEVGDVHIQELPILLSVR